MLDVTLSEYFFVLIKILNVQLDNNDIRILLPYGAQNVVLTNGLPMEFVIDISGCRITVAYNT